MTVAGIARLGGEGAGRPAGGWWGHLRAGKLLFARPLASPLCWALSLEAALAVLMGPLALCFWLGSANGGPGRKPEDRGGSGWEIQSSHLLLSHGR